MAGSEECKPTKEGIGLREYFTLWLNNIEKLFEERCKRIDERFANIEESRALALKAMEARLAGMNEFRETLRDQAAKFFTKAEHEAYMKATEIELRALQDFKLTLDTKASASQVTWAYIIGGSGLVISIITIVKEFIK
jgi:hypothetical protein